MIIRSDFKYNNIEINNFRQPNIVIDHTISIKLDQDDNSLYVKINEIDYRLDIYERLIENSQDMRLIKLDDVKIYEPSFLTFDSISRKYVTNRSTLFEIPSQDFSKIINSKMKGNKIVLSVECTIKCEIYKSQNGYFLLKTIGLFDNKFMYRDQNTNRITLTDEEISILIKGNRYTEIIKLNISLEKEFAINDSLRNAIEQLKSASKGFEDGNYYTVLVNSRNAIFNYLTEYNTNRKRRVIKQEIKDIYLSNTPEKLTKFYEDIFHEIERMTSSISGLLSKFIHTDSDKVIQRPLIADLELIYFSICLLIRYLTKLTNSKII